MSKSRMKYKYSIAEIQELRKYREITYVQELITFKNYPKRFPQSLSSESIPCFVLFPLLKGGLCVEQILQKKRVDVRVFVRSCS